MRDRTNDAVGGLRESLIGFCHRAYALGLVPGISGNMSCRVPGQERIVVKASGFSLGDVTEAETLLADLDGTILQETSLRPSKELFFHLAIYRQRPDVGAVVHLHPPHTLVFAALHTLPPLLTGAARIFLGDKLVLIPPARSGSKELAQLVGTAFADVKIKAAIMAEHGSITVGADLPEAFYLSQYLEDAARTAFLVRQWQAPQA